MTEQVYGMWNVDEFIRNLSDADWAMLEQYFHEERKVCEIFKLNKIQYKQVYDCFSLFIDY